MNHRHSKGHKKRQGSKKNLARVRLPLLNFTTDEIGLFVDILDLLMKIASDQQCEAAMPTIREIGQQTSETQQKLHQLKDHVGDIVLFENNDYIVLYTAILLFIQVKLFMPVLLPESLALQGVAARLLELEKKVAPIVQHR